MNPAKTQPALLGGVTIGVLSALPVVMIGNCCCCAWILFGGALAAYLMQQNHVEPIQIGDGAIVGLMSGVVGAVVWLVVSVPINIAFSGMNSRFAQQVIRNSSELPPELRSLFENVSTGGAEIGVGLVLGFFVMLVVMTMFGMVGGLFGALVFRKKPLPVIPPIPPAERF